MKAIITSLLPYISDKRVNPSVIFYNDDGTVVEENAGGIDVPLSGMDDHPTFKSSIESAIQTYASNQSYSIEPVIWAGANDHSPKSFATPSRSLNSAFQIDTDRDALASYSVDIACSSTALSGEKGRVELKYADDSGITTNVVTVARIENGTGALLNLSNNKTEVLSGLIPAGKYVKLVTTNITGSPTITLISAQEVLI